MWHPVVRNHLTKSREKLPLPFHKIISLCKLINNQYFLSFSKKNYLTKNGFTDGIHYKQCTFLSGPYKHVIHKNSTYLRYLDDIFLMYLHNGNLLKCAHHEETRQRRINPRHYTWKKKQYPTCPRYYINSKEEQIRFKVYHKSTTKNDLNNFYPHQKLISVLIICFYLRLNIDLFEYAVQNT